MLSFEVSIMEVISLIKKAKGLIFSAKKKKKKKENVTWQVRIGWRKTNILRQLLTHCFLK